MAVGCAFIAAKTFASMVASRSGAAVATSVVVSMVGLTSSLTLASTVASMLGVGAAGAAVQAYAISTTMGSRTCTTSGLVMGGKLTLVAHPYVVRRRLEF